MPSLLPICRQMHADGGTGEKGQEEEEATKARWSWGSPGKGELECCQAPAHKGEQRTQRGQEGQRHGDGRGCSGSPQARRRDMGQPSRVPSSYSARCVTLGSTAGTEASTHTVQFLNSALVKLPFWKLACPAPRPTGNTCLYLKCSQGCLYQTNIVIKERAPASSLGVTCGQLLAESIREIKPIFSQIARS